MSGWITLHRKFLDWEWYADQNTSRLFLHLLLTANHRDKKWRGTVIKRGQVLTGRRALADATRMSEKSVRTALNHLQSTNEVAIKSTRKYSIITITNWDKYQDKGQQTDQQGANKGPTRGQQRATTNNENNVNNENNNRGSGKYAFEGKVIRLNQTDFDTWEKNFDSIPSLKATLTALDAHYATLSVSEQKAWFQRTAGALAKKNAEFVKAKPKPMRLVSAKVIEPAGDDWRTEDERHG